MAQVTMYDGIANSPEMEVAVLLTIGGTSLTLTGVSGLPAAPNRLTLGDGADAETCMYSAIVGNVVTIARSGTGHEGTAKEWPVGTVVKRAWCNVDYANVKANIEDLASRGVITSDTPEQGDIPYRGASAFNLLHHGNAYQPVLSGGHAADPSFSDIDGGTAALQKTVVKVRQDTEANWCNSNPTPSSGELCNCSDRSRMKIGNGTTTWNGLPYTIIAPRNYVDGDPRKMVLTQDTERFVDIDDFSNNTLGQYTLTGNPTISSGVLTLATTEKAIKAINPASTTGKWAVVLAFTTTYSTDQSAKFYFGATSYLDIQRKTSNAIYLQLTVNGAPVIASTSASATLADSVFGRAELTYDGTNYQMIWNGANIGSATAGNAPTTPSKGLLATASTVVADKWDYIPSVTFTDPFTADTEARYHQIQIPAGAGADDIVVGGGVMTIAGTGGNERSLYAVLKSYNFVSGEYEIAFKNNGDGGGGANTICVFFGQLDVQNTYRLTVNDNGTGSAVDLRLYYLFNNYSTQIGSTKDISGRYVLGNKTWVKIQWDAIAGRFWIYLRDDAGVYPTTPDISDAFSTLFSAGKFGFGQIVSTAGAGNLNVSFYPPTVRAHCLIGETNVPTTETGYYFRDEYTTNSIGRYTTTGTWAVSGGVLSCSGAGNCKMPFGTDIGVHTFTPTFANGTDYYYFGGYRLKFVASGGNTCVITLETAAGVAQGSGSLTVTTTAGAFVTPVIINQAATSITVMCSGATGAIISGTTVVTAGVPYFSVGTATCTFDNYSFSGSRAYNKPMLRGAQIGEYWNGTQSVYCTRFCDDFDWDTIVEYTGVAASSVDTANGYLTLAETTYIYPAWPSLSEGTANITLLRSGASGSVDITFCNNVINITYAGAVAFNGGAAESWSVDVLSSPVLISLVATGTSIAVYSNGILKGTKTGLTLAASNFKMKRNTANFYVYSIQVNGVAASSLNGCNLTLGGVPHGARYDVQESGTLSFTNLAKYGKYWLLTAAKTTNASAEDAGHYFRNLTDTSNISLDATNTQDYALTTTGATDFTKELLLDADDRSDTITLQARRKTAATDNSAAVFVEYLALVPIAEVG